MVNKIFGHGDLTPIYLKIISIKTDKNIDRETYTVILKIVTDKPIIRGQIGDKLLMYIEE